MGRSAAPALVVLALVVAWTWWLYRRLAAAPQWPTWARRAVLAVVVAGAAALLTAQLAFRALDPDPWRPVIWLGLTWLGLGFYLTLGLALLGVAALGLRAVRARRARLWLLRAGTPLVVALTLGLTGHGLSAASRLQVASYQVESASLPPGLDGLRVAFVSDLHVGPTRDGELTRRVVDLVNGQRPDLVLLGGDLSDGRLEYVGDYLDPLADLRAPLGVFGVSGNHEARSPDGASLLETWEALGVRVLRNEHVEVTRAGDRLTLAGAHDAQGEGAFASDAEQALAGVQPDEFTMFLAHEPRQVPTGAGVDVALTGHTHGGQLWPFHHVVRWQQPTLAGVDRVEDVTMVTSRGVHASGPPMRVLASPEVTVVVLRSPDAVSSR